MAIQTTKLSEVEIINSAVNPKLIIEDEGEIKRISPEVVAPSQVQADWDEEDTTSPSYIQNKPDISSGGGGAVYVYNAGGHPTVDVLSIELDSSLSAQENSDLFYERVSSGLIILKWEDGLITPVLGYDVDGSNVTIAICHGYVRYMSSNLLPPSAI